MEVEISEKQILEFQEFRRLYLENRDKIIEMLKNCNDEFILEPSLKNQNNSLLEIGTNYIKVRYLTPEMKEDIKTYLPKTIKKINIPQYDLDFDYLSWFTNLDTIVLDEINEEILKNIYEKTSIKNVLLRYSYSLISDKIKGLVSEDRHKMGIYKDITIEMLTPKKENNVRSLTFVSPEMDMEQIEKLYYRLNLKKAPFKISLTSELLFGKYHEIIIRKKGIQIISYLQDNSEFKKIYDYLENKGYKVEKVTVNIGSTIDIYNYDYSYLDKLAKETKISITNRFFEEVEYEEFKSQIEGIKWYRSLINNSDLSPLEKLIYAYDIMKSFPYNKDPKNDIESRNPAKVLSSTYIVCVGYTNVLDEILRNVDSNLRHIAVDVDCFDEKDYLGGHSRSMIYIDDDKYDIHGPYILDPTWDSDRGTYGIRAYGSDYNALDLYRFFLVPILDYKKVFGNDLLPLIFDDAKLNENVTLEGLEYYKNHLPTNESILRYRVSNLFDKGTDNKKIIDSFKNKRISFSKLLEAIRNTRLHEGFTLDNVDKEIEKVSRINAPYYEDGFVLSKEDIIQIK